MSEGENVRAALGTAALRAGSALSGELLDETVKGLEALESVAPEVERLGKERLSSAVALELFDADADAAPLYLKRSRGPLDRLEAANREDLSAFDKEEATRRDWEAISAALKRIGGRAAMLGLTYLLAAL